MKNPFTQIDGIAAGLVIGGVALGFMGGVIVFSGDDNEAPDSCLAALEEADEFIQIMMDKNDAEMELFGRLAVDPLDASATETYLAAFEDAAARTEVLTYAGDSDECRAS